MNTEQLATFCKQKGFVFQAAEIYNGLAGFFDYGPLGVELKNNIKQAYHKRFVTKKQDVVAQDGSIITNPKVWKASGHLDNFADLVLTTKKTKTKIRADHFIEDQLKIPADGMNAADINKLIEEHGLTHNGEEFEEIQDFNLMFQTQVGPSSDKAATAYLRPETCQSIFPNFRLIADVSRLQLPFGIAQIGKAFRNEISPRDFIFRCREFEQMEMEYFFNPEVAEYAKLSQAHKDLTFSFLSAENQDADSSEVVSITIQDLLDKKKCNEYQAYWVAECLMFANQDLGLSNENLRIREHVSTELSHYSTATFDVEYQFFHGFKEMIGIANRGNFDLTQHGKHAKAKLEIFDEATKAKVLPHVIEPSMGLDRIFMAVVSESYTKDEERGNVNLKLPHTLAPYKIAIFPLMGKPELTSVAEGIFNDLIDADIVAVYDKAGSVGKRYARQDEIGTPYCVTVDYETIEDGENKGTVTIRNRDTTEQERIKIEDVKAYLS